MSYRRYCSGRSKDNDGFDKLEAKLKRNMNLGAVRTVVRKNGADLQTKAQKNAPVGTPQSTGIPGYVGGTLKRSVELDITDGGLTAEVEPTADYALTLNTAHDSWKHSLI